jgi:beta-glucanase (GH16 family)
VGPSPDGFHTYSVDWTPRSFTFRYDGARCLRVDRWTPAAPLAAPAPFDRPFFVALEFATGIKQNSPRPTMPLPQTMQVDYVRVWGRGAGR